MLCFSIVCSVLLTGENSDLNVHFLKTELYIQPSASQSKTRVELTVRSAWICPFPLDTLCDLIWLFNEALRKEYRFSYPSLLNTKVETNEILLFPVFLGKNAMVPYWERLPLIKLQFFWLTTAVPDSKSLSNSLNHTTRINHTLMFQCIQSLSTLEFMTSWYDVSTFLNKHMPIFSCCLCTASTSCLSAQSSEMNWLNSNKKYGQQ